MVQADRAGTFRASIQSYSLFAAEGSDALAVSVRCKLLQMYHNEEWHDWEEYDMYADGKIWILKKDGKLNTKAAQSLIQHAGWDGDLQSIDGETWEPSPCGVTLTEDEYRGETRFNVAFINDYDSTGKGGGNVDAKKVKELNTRLGGELRALVGTAKANAKKPSGKPPAPPSNPNRELAEMAAEYEGEEDLGF